MKEQYKLHLSINKNIRSLVAAICNYYNGMVVSLLLSNPAGKI